MGFLFQCRFLKKNNFFYKTALHTAIEKGNVEIANLLLSNKTINVNIKTILDLINLNKISQKKIFLNTISNYNLQ